MPLRETVLLIPDDPDRKALIRATRPDLSLLSCRNVDALQKLIKPSVDTIVCGAGMGLLTQLNVVERIDDCAITFVFRLELTDVAVAEFVALARRLPNIRVSLRTPLGANDFASELVTLVSEPDCGPTGLIVSRIADLLPIEAHRIVVAALVLGRTRVDVTIYARTCGISPRSIQAAVQGFGLPSPHRLLLWGQAFWMAWRMSRYGMSSKQAATAGGFVTASSMAGVLRSVTGEPPMKLARLGGFTRLAERFQSELLAYRSRRSRSAPELVFREVTHEVEELERSVS